MEILRRKIQAEVIPGTPVLSEEKAQLCLGIISKSSILRVNGDTEVLHFLKNKQINK